MLQKPESELEETIKSLASRCWWAPRWEKSMDDLIEGQLHV